MYSEEMYNNDAVHIYMSEITSKIVAKSGIPSDRYHIGKIILQCLQDDPDFVNQIDGSTGKSETNGEVLKKVIKCVQAFKTIGLKQGDVMALLAPNNLELAIPFYAAMFLGIIIAPVDRFLVVNELKSIFEMIEPNLVFCLNEKVEDVIKALKLSGLDSKVITFDKSPHAVNLAAMLEKAGEDIDIQAFKAVDLDPEDATAMLIPTSGTTGLPKSACITHKNFALSALPLWSYFSKFPSPVSSVLVVAPLQWLSCIIPYIHGPFIKYTRIQSPLLMTHKHICKIITDHKPTFIIISPTMMIPLLREAEAIQCDLSCFNLMYFGGSAVPTELLVDIRKHNSKAIVADVYGMSELGCLAFYGIGAPLGSCGKRVGYLQYRLMDIETNQEIHEPRKSGELWLKIPGGGFKGYYNRPEETKEVYSEDGWFKTGDILYRDENWNYYFVERMKLLLKYKNHQISPVEVESVIRQHPGVLDVAVTGIPDLECGELPVACVVKNPGKDVSAKEIEDLVKENLTDSKHLRGGVIFLDELPLTASTKIHRRKIKDLAIAHASSLLTTS